METDIVLFAADTGDDNAQYINAEYAATLLKSRIAPGILPASLIFAAIANTCQVRAA